MKRLTEWRNRGGLARLLKRSGKATAVRVAVGWAAFGVLPLLGCGLAVSFAVSTGASWALFAGLIIGGAKCQ